MSACLVNGASGLHCAIQADDEVVADACPALGTMPAIDVGGSEVLALGCGRAMNDEFVDGSHSGRPTPTLPLGEGVPCGTRGELGV